MCGWPAARPPVNIMQVYCCDLPCVSPPLRSITRTYWTPPQTPPTPPLLAEGLACAFSTSLSYIPSLKRAVSARLLENYRSSIDRMSSIVHNKIDGWGIMKQWRLWAFVLNCLMYPFLFIRKGLDNVMIQEVLIHARCDTTRRWATRGKRTCGIMGEEKREERGVFTLRVLIHYRKGEARSVTLSQWCHLYATWKVT